MVTADLRDLLPVIAAREAADPESYPAETVADLYGLGLPQGPFPGALGGAGLSLQESVDAIEALATASPSAALIICMPLGLAGLYGLGPGAAPAQYRDAFWEQAERVAADYRAGRVYAACNSERGAGGSLAATKTVAERRDGRFLLTGEKILASSGRFASTFYSTA